MNLHASFQRLIFAFLSVCTACGSGGDESLVMVRDSAGIQIVESQRPRWQEGEGWTLSAEPILEIGVTEGEDAYLLNGVASVARFEDGTIVVANGGDNTLRYYDSSGTFLRSAGGRGRGPAEFSQIMGLRRMADSVLAWQFMMGPGKVFDLQGNLVRVMRGPTQMALIQGAFADGAQLFEASSGGQLAEGMHLDSTLLYLSTPDFAESDSIVRLPGGYRLVIGTGRQRIISSQEYGPGQVVAVGDREWYYGWPETYEFRVLDRDGAVRRIVRRAWDPIPVSDADRQRHRDRMLAAEPEGGNPMMRRTPLEQRRAIVNAMVYPDHHPAFRRILPDETGSVWVERVDPEHPGPIRDVPTTWDVFDPSGAWLGPVESPSRFYVYQIDETHMVGVWRDEMDVQRVRVYELLKQQ